MIQVFDKFARRRANMIENAYGREAGLRGNQYRHTNASLKRQEAMRNDNAETAAEALDAIQTVVSALSSRDGGRYTVVFGDVPGDTNLTTRQIRITSKPLFDKDIKLKDACIVLTGIAMHEIGHTWISGQTEGLLVANDMWANQTIKTVAFVLDDERLDFMERRRFPGMAFAIRPTQKYVAKMTGLPEREPVRFSAQASMFEKLNFMIFAVRYAPYVRWIGNADTRAERGWWQAWARLNADAQTDDEIMAAINEAVDHLRMPVEDQPEQQPEQDEDEPVEEPEQPESDNDDDDDDDEDEDEDALDQNDQGTNDDDFEDEDEDESEAGDPNADEGEGEPSDDDDEAQSDGSGSDDYEDSDSDDDGDAEAEGDTAVGDSNDNGDAVGDDIDEVEASEIESAEPDIKSIDDFNESQEIDDQLQASIVAEREIERVTRSDGFGSMKIKIS